MAAHPGHDHGVAGRALRTALLLTALILVVELAAGILAHSLALLADAGHVFTDIVALGLAWFASTQAERPADAGKTYGYHRSGILAALLNAALLILIVAAVAYEAIQRLRHPTAVTPWLLLVAAGIGITLNLYIAARLRAEHDGSLNIRAALLHVLGDIGASVGVVIAAAIIALTQWYPIDPILSLAIAGLIALGAWTILRETVDILMESAPRGLDVTQLVRDMVHSPGVQDVHDLHVWSIAGGMSALSAHVQIEDQPLSRCDAVLAGMTEMLRQRYHIGHATIQLECAGCETTHLYCNLNQNGKHRHEALEEGTTAARRAAP
ncbi:MAG TPA: cation diffusion facilitator family transporter [Chloroflexota bacterium]|nr:cation diffusion facilitator family transporter [Chloroflexota bacterium]